METPIELEQLRTVSTSDSTSSEGSSPQSSPRTSPKNLIKKSTLALIKRMSNFDLTEEADNVNPITLLKVHQVVILICSILLMILLLQIPTILYYANSPTSPSSVDVGFDIDFKTCTVSAYLHIAIVCTCLRNFFSKTVGTDFKNIVRCITQNVWCTHKLQELQILCIYSIGSSHSTPCRCLVYYLWYSCHCQTVALTTVWLHVTSENARSFVVSTSQNVCHILCCASLFWCSNP